MEDTDFASGLSLCLTRDGQGTPNQTLNWAQALNLTRGSDGAQFSVSRTGGTNNPGFQVVLTDSTSNILLNNTLSGGTIALGVNGTAGFSVGASGALAKSGTASAPGYSFASSTNDGIYLVAAGDVGIATAGVERIDIQSTGVTFNVVLLAAAGSATAPGLAFSGNTNSGLYSPGAGQLGFAASGASAGTISTAGAWSLPAATGAVTFTTAGAANQYADAINGNSASGQSFGLVISAGTTTADFAAKIRNQGATQDYFDVQGNGETFVVTPPAASSPPSGTFQIGYMECPLNSQSTSYTLAMSDRGKMVQLTGGTTLTIPANAVTALPVGTTVVVNNLTGASITIALSSDTLQWQPSFTSGNRTLAYGGIATLYKRASTTWVIWGFNIS